MRTAEEGNKDQSFGDQSGRANSIRATESRVRDLLKSHWLHNIPVKPEHDPGHPFQTGKVVENSKWKYLIIFLKKIMLSFRRQFFLTGNTFH